MNTYQPLAQNSAQNPAQNPAPNSTSTPSVFRPRRSDDWHEYRDTIEQLYRNDQLKLRDVKHIMERDYKFFASEKQYKDRLAAWHVRKNIKAKEVHLMIRKQQKRAAQGKQTAFRVNGQNVDPKRINRFIRRYGSSLDPDWDKKTDTESPAHEPMTPPGIECYTPEPEISSGTTPVSPLEMPFPIYDPNHLQNLPDLVIGDHPPMPPVMPNHNNYQSIGSHSGSHGSSVPMPVPVTHDRSAEYRTHQPDWNSIESFQNRLQNLDHTLTLSMAKWQNPNSHQDIAHHEGMGI